MLPIKDYFRFAPDSRRMSLSWRLSDFAPIPIYDFVVSHWVREIGQKTRLKSGAARSTISVLSAKVNYFVNVRRASAGLSTVPTNGARRR